MSFSQPPSPGDITLLLSQLTPERLEIAEELYPLVKDELHRKARHLMRHDRGHITIEPDELAAQAYLKVTRSAVAWNDRHHLFGFLYFCMVRFLMDRRKKRNALRRGVGLKRVELEEAYSVAAPEPSRDKVTLREALARLKALDPDQAQIIELRYMQGRSLKEAAKLVCRGTSRVKKDTASGLAFLRRELECAS